MCFLSKFNMKIKKSLIDDCYLAARNYFPNEFACLLGVDKNNVFSEFVLFFQQSSQNSAYLDIFSKPFDSSIKGSFHSHPLGPPIPSKADKVFFKNYKFNVIMSLNENSFYFEVYDSSSKKVKYEIIDKD
jgi:proteasome lid subunit RPN8/RPN11